MTDPDTVPRRLAEPLPPRAPRRPGRWGRRLVLLAAILLGLGLARPDAPAQAQRYVLATATVGGTYYPVGLALATLLRARLQPASGIQVTAVSSAGSIDNVRLLREGQAQFAILSSLAGYHAWTGQGDFAAPEAGLRAVAALWQEAEHFVVGKEYARTGTIADMHNLKGRAVSLGLKDSGTLALNRLLLGRLGIDIDADLKLVYLGYGASADALLKGRIEAMSTSAGVPVTAVTHVLLGKGGQLAILEFTPAQQQRINAGVELWSRYLIPAGTYPAQDRPIATVATTAFLAVRADVDADVVYRITKTIYDNLPFLQAIHRAVRDMALDRALTGLPVPLHPGALRYYREAGLAVPARLAGDDAAPP